jgi:NAD(P)-dependent dehydrogenase (short-subunit alcohol dehydrogenase family)
MDLGVAGKVAIITGGSDGIGKATAKILAAGGASVAICARTAETLEAAANEIRSSTGGNVLAVPCDVTSAADIERLVATTIEKLGPPTLLANNAGTSAAGNFMSVTDERWAADLDLKLHAAIRLSRLVVPHMKKGDVGGSFGKVTAVKVKHPGANSTPTSVSRAAGIALTKAMSKDLAADNIRVNTVCIGLIKSGQINRFASARGDSNLEAGYAAMGAGVPLGRVGEAEEAGRVVAFLLSNAASYVTGVAVNIDGGTSSSV